MKSVGSFMFIPQGVHFRSRYSTISLCSSFGGTVTLSSSNSSLFIFGIFTLLSSGICLVNALDSIKYQRYFESNFVSIGYISALHNPSKVAITILLSLGLIFE